MKLWESLLLVLSLLGLLGVVVFGYYAWVDWEALRVAYVRFERVAQVHSDLPTLFVAEAHQNIHRINLFADGVWTLLSAILAAIGMHGLVVSRGSRRP
jgi:type IV secretory pathway ATPase VirB11/archaellum biosynthesis ATPase